jgi:PncC family amidohydrolase
VESSTADERLEARLGAALRARRWRLAVAESCTGGLVGHRVTDVPGSSDYFSGGVIAYANEVKQSLLGVQADTLAAHGAVSEAVALEMARGARAVCGAEVGLAVTGIAGPGGGGPGKPVGLTWIAVSTPEVERAEQRVWPGDRAQVKAQSAQAALALALAVVAPPG